MSYHKSLKILNILTRKCIQTLFRRPSIQRLIIVSMIVVYGGLYAVYQSTKGQTLHYLGGNGYTPLSFDYYCKPETGINVESNPLNGIVIDTSIVDNEMMTAQIAEETQHKSADTKKFHDVNFDERSLSYLDEILRLEDVNPFPEKPKEISTKIHCYPRQTPSGPNDKLSPSQLLANILSSGSLYGQSDDGSSKKSKKHANVQTDALAELLSSLLMNGAPLLGLVDFIHLSDFTNKQLGSEGKMRLMSYSAYRERFSNFLDIRNKDIHIVSDSSCMGYSLRGYLRDLLGSENALNITIHKNMREAEKSCCENVFAIVDVSYSNTDLIEWRAVEDFYTDMDIETKCYAENLAHFNQSNSGVPAVTIRMHPSAIPDTRNYKWTPTRGSVQKLESGQLLYLLSGFLALQFEIQNFFGLTGFGGRYIDSDIFSTTSSLTRPGEFSKKMAEAVAAALIESKSVYQSVLNVSQSIPSKREDIAVPIYHRAFPTHPYQQQLFFHTFGSILSITLIIFFSLPAAVIGGSYLKEVSGGHLDVLSTYPQLRQYHSSLAWCLCGMLWVFASFFVTWIFFLCILTHSSALIPSLALLFCGWSLGPLSIILGLALKRSEEIALAIPSVVFVFMLPGMLYNDLAFDIQRHTWMELIISLLPSSAATLILRQVFSHEALGVSVDWSFMSPVSDTPINYYLLMLAFDYLVLLILATGLVNFFEPIKNKLESSSDTSAQSSFIGYCCNFIVLIFDRTFSVIIISYNGAKRFVWRLFTIRRETSYSLLSTSPMYHSTLDRDIAHDMRNNRSQSTSNVLSNDIEMVSPGDDRRRSSSLDSSAYYYSDKKLPSINEGRIGISTITEDIDHERYHINSSMDSNPFSVVIDSVTKTFTTNNITVEVLSNINAILLHGKIYTLLGSNGAGKTTFLRILCGLDSTFTGSVNINFDKSDSTRRGKTTGWCPQVDPIFDYLTVEEHLDLFGSLLDISSEKRKIPSNDIGNTVEASWHSNEYKRSLLLELDMLSHRHKYGCELSGGMKRRLSLMIAFMGNPSFLLLDEPSSGCDSWNRERIRISLLGRKLYSSILLSTHHIDDMEVLSDHVLFLNERHLVYDGSYNDLIGKYSTIFHPAIKGFASQNELSETEVNYSIYEKRSLSKQAKIASFNTIIFSTTDPNILYEFLQLFHEIVSVIDENHRYALKGLSNQDFNRFLDFLSQLEHRKMNSWSISSPNIHYCLENMYQQSHGRSSSANTPSSQPKMNESLRNGLIDEPGTHLRDRQYKSNADKDRRQRSKSRYLSSFFALSSMRWNEVKAHLPEYILSNVLFPFLVVWVICVGCRDVRYPKLELTSKLSDGIGEIVVGYNNKPLTSDLRIHGQYVDPASAGLRSLNEENDESSSQMRMQSQPDKMNDERSVYETISLSSSDNPQRQSKVTYNGYSFLKESLPKHSLKWIDATTSNHLWNNLYKEYYGHKYDRWNAFVLQDIITDWFETSVYLNANDFSPDLHVNMSKVFSDIAAAQSRICNITKPSSKYKIKNIDTVNIPPMDSSDQYVDLNGIDQGNSQPSEVNICGHKPMLEIFLTQSNLSHVSSVNRSNSELSLDDTLVIRATEALYSNLTMLSNVTSSHATPIFLKEIVPIVYESLFRHNIRTNKVSASANLDAESSYIMDSEPALLPEYKLFSSPLPVTNLSNEVFIERGYVGSVIILMYILICSTKSVRVITSLRFTQVKALLHTKGLSCSSYWTTIALHDILSCLITYIAIGFAILLGGNPVSSFYMQFPPLFGIFYISLCGLFSMAIVTSSYAFSAMSEDQLTSQLLMLITTIFNGIFMKLYFDKHMYQPYLMVSDIILSLSPSYAIATCFFELFRWHAVNMTWSLTASSSIDDTTRKYQTQINESKEVISKCMYSLLAQFIFYLLITIAIDKWSFLVRLYIRRLVRIIGLYVKSISKLGTSRSKDDFSQLKLSSTSDNVGKGLIRHLSLRGKLGIFPYLDNRDKMALQSHHEDLFRSSSHVSINRTQDENNDSVTIDSYEDDKMSHISVFTDETGDVAILSNCLGLNRLASYQHDDESDHHGNHNRLADISNVYVEYPSRGNRKAFAIKDLNFSVNIGEKVALMGSSGGGKSTLFKTLALAHNIPISGHISILNQDIIHDLWTVCENQSVGYVPQEKGLLEFLTVKEALQLFYDVSVSDDNQLNYVPFDEWISFVTTDNIITDNESHKLDYGIIPRKYLHYPIYALSGGNKKKLLLVLAQIGIPSFLLLDEITTGVDPIAADRIVSYLKSNKLNDLNGEVSHDINGVSSIETNVDNMHISSTLSINKNAVSKTLTINNGKYEDIKDSEEHADGNQMLNGQQGLLFASHRIDECNSLCDRVIIIHEGMLFFDGPISSFSSIASSFYQVDIYLPQVFVTSPPNKQGIGYHESDSHQVNRLRAMKQKRKQKNVIDSLDMFCKEMGSTFERLLIYSTNLIRITFEREHLPISAIWRQLETIRLHGDIERYAFREMDMEEALSNMIESTKPNDSTAQ